MAGSVVRMNGQVKRLLDGKLGALHGLSFVDFNVLLELSAQPQGKAQESRPRGETRRDAVRDHPHPDPARKNRTHHARTRRARRARRQCRITKTGRRICREALETADELAQKVCEAQSTELSVLHATLLRVRRSIQRSIPSADSRRVRCRASSSRRSRA